MDCLTGQWYPRKKWPLTNSLNLTILRIDKKQEVTCLTLAGSLFQAWFCRIWFSTSAFILLYQWSSDVKPSRRQKLTKFTKILFHPCRHLPCWMDFWQLPVCNANFYWLIFWNRPIRIVLQKYVGFSLLKNGCHKKLKKTTQIFQIFISYDSNRT